MLVLKIYVFIHTTIAVSKISPYFSSKALADRCQSWRSKSSSDEEMTKAYLANTQTVDLRHPVKLVETIDKSSYSCSCTGLTMSDFCNTCSQINKSTDCQSIDTLSNPVVNTNFARDIDNQPSQESDIDNQPSQESDIDNQPSQESNHPPEVIHSTVIMNPSHIPNLTAEAFGNNKSKKNYRSVYGRKKEECAGGSHEEFMMTSLDDRKPEVFPKNVC